MLSIEFGLPHWPFALLAASAICVVTALLLWANHPKRPSRHRKQTIAALLTTAAMLILTTAAATQR